MAPMHKAICIESLGRWVVPADKPVVNHVVKGALNILQLAGHLH